MSAYSVRFHQILSQDILRTFPQLRGILSSDILLREYLAECKGSVREYAAVSLYHNIFKKYLDDVDKDADKKAIDMFLKKNHECGLYIFPKTSLNSFENRIISEMIITFDRYFNWVAMTSAWTEMSKLMEHGPGASAGVKGTSFYHKVGDANLTMTHRVLYEYYKYSISNDPNWACVEEIRKSRHGAPLVLRGSHLSCVPKRTDISRTICSEPSLNMLFQLGLGNTMIEYLKLKFGIHIRNDGRSLPQPFKNRELARRGSSDGGLSTIDLSSASDSFALDLVKHIVPKALFDIMCVIRSKETRLPNGEWVSLQMVSSMGNGFTFPFMTLFFTAMVLAVYKESGINPLLPRGRALGNFAVFGDDLIVDTRVHEKVLHMLQVFGFSVNQEKTFAKGSFRESCGGDYILGADVRPVFCKRLDSPQDRVSLINRLIRWSAVHRVFLIDTVAFLSEGYSFPTVPYSDQDSAGLKVPLELADFHYDRNRSFRYTRWDPKPIRYDMSNRPAEGSFPLGANPAAILLSALKGTLRDTFLSLRMEKVRYAKRRHVTPCWDYIPADSLDFQDYRAPLREWIAAALLMVGRP